MFRHANLFSASLHLNHTQGKYCSSRSRDVRAWEEWVRAGRSAGGLMVAVCVSVAGWVLHPRELKHSAVRCKMRVWRCQKPVKPTDFCSSSPPLHLRSSQSVQSICLLLTRAVALFSFYIIYLPVPGVKVWASLSLRVRKDVEFGKLTDVTLIAFHTVVQ